MFQYNKDKRDPVKTKKNAVEKQNTTRKSCNRPNGQKGFFLLVWPGGCFGKSRWSLRRRSGGGGGGGWGGGGEGEKKARAKKAKIQVNQVSGSRVPTVSKMATPPTPSFFILHLATIAGHLCFLLSTYASFSVFCSLFFSFFLRRSIKERSRISTAVTIPLLTPSTGRWHRFFGARPCFT